MKKIIAIISIIVILSISSMSYADTPVRKLGRGLANMITCVFEWPKGVVDVNAESGPVAAFTLGVVQGLYKTGVRAVVGIYETATFWLPVPDNYEPILKDPEFFFEEGLF